MALARMLAAMVLAALAAAPAQSPPLPDQETFFAEVRKRLASNDLIQSRYSFRERTTELKLNPLGRMGTGPYLVYEVYPHPNDELTYRRLVERAGRALAPAEIAEQDRRYRKRLAGWQQSVAREGMTERTARLRKAQEVRDRDAAQAREALDMFVFRIESRDVWEGQPAIIISFTPKPEAVARSREGRVARVFAGRAWVHETAYEVMNVEARAIDDVAFGYGMIARLHEGSTARFTRRRVGDEWLPVETHFDGTGRALLVRKIVIQFERQYYDYRPFDVSDLSARLGWSP